MLDAAHYTQTFRITDEENYRFNNNPDLEIFDAHLEENNRAIVWDSKKITDTEEYRYSIKAGVRYDIYSGNFKLSPFFDTPILLRMRMRLLNIGMCITSRPGCSYVMVFSKSRISIFFEKICFLHLINGVGLEIHIFQ